MQVMLSGLVTMIVIFLGECATTESTPSIAYKPGCCASMDDFQFAALQPGSETRISLDEESPTYLFEGLK